MHIVKDQSSNQSPEQIDVIKIIDDLLNCTDKLYKQQIDTMPDLSKCDFIEFNLNNYSNDIYKIGIFFYQEDIFIGVLNKDNNNDFYKTTRDSKHSIDFQKCILTLSSLLKGNESERSFINVTSHKPLYTGSWQIMMNQKQLDEYYNEIHENIIKSVFSLLNIDIILNKKVYRILDIFGGNGKLLKKLAEKIIKDNRFDSNRFEFFLIDSDNDILKEAEKRLSEIHSDRFQINTILYDLRSGDKPSIGNYDFIISSGGLTGEVITSEPAISITKWVYERLNMTGKFIASGKADLLINKEILSKIGFNVINCTAMSYGIKPKIIQHYIAIKLEKPCIPEPALAYQLQSD